MLAQSMEYLPLNETSSVRFKTSIGASDYNVVENVKVIGKKKGIVSEVFFVRIGNVFGKATRSNMANEADLQCTETIELGSGSQGFYFTEASISKYLGIPLELVK